MRTSILAVASTIALATAAHAQDVRVETFQHICIDARESFAVGEAAALERGWAEVSERSRPELQRVFEFARTADTTETPINHLQAYANPTLEGVSVVLSEMTIRGRRINGCYVYDFAATEALAPDVFIQIAGSQPTESYNHPDLVVMQKWVAPPTLEGVATLRAGYVPRGSEAGEQVGIVGLALAITSFSRGALE